VRSTQIAPSQLARPANALYASPLIFRNKSRGSSPKQVTGLPAEARSGRSGRSRTPPPRTAANALWACRATRVRPLL